MKLTAENYQRKYLRLVSEAMRNCPQHRILQDSDIRHLPLPVQKYLYYTRSIGKAIPHTMFLRFSGEFKSGFDKPFVPFCAEQHNFFHNPARYYLMSLKMKGIVAKGLHVFSHGHARMQIKLLGIAEVVDALGNIMDQSETVTYFNDMCLMAPAALAFEDIKWEMLDALSVKAVFHSGSQTITAILYFDEEGRLSNFYSNDRLASPDGIHFNRYPWLTPVHEYKEYNGRMLPSYGEAIWKRPEGDFCYGRFYLKEARFNTQKINKK